MQNFNPLPRKEGDGWADIKGAAIVAISIHSLVKRETKNKCHIFFGSLYISIHSLVKRETVPAVAAPAEKTISIHSLVKRETHAAQQDDSPIKISIHSLVKRET